ncbi:MAG: hypothetical protein KBC56_09685 [Flavobacterium sp.]|nr:hypothetical protein [Flavobacterium sp.]
MKKALFFLLISIAANSQCLTSTTWNGTLWTNGAPNVTTIARIDAPYIITGTAPYVNFDCCDLIVNSDLQINNNRFVTVQNDVKVNGNLIVKSGGKLCQFSNSPNNTGVITVERTTPILKLYDYEYWSSPVTTTINQPLGTWWNIRTFFMNPSNWFDIEESYNGNWISNNPDNQDDNGNAWTLAPQSMIPMPAQGIATMVNPIWTFPTTQTVTFTGAPNAGIINIPLQLSANPLENNDDANLVGNPYPAPILADTFIIDNIPNITGTIAYWTHQGSLSASYPGLEQLNFLASDYAFYNLSGGIAATFGGSVPTPFIASCQGFMVDAETNTNLIFKPTYMAAGYPNNGFYRIGDPKKLRLSITNDSHELFSQILLNYQDGTSLQFDYGYDSKLKPMKVPIQLYSIEEDNFNIQARGEFNASDVVKIGYKSAVAESFAISINDIIGIDNAYIKDNGIIHELPYTFTSEIGESNNRFEIVYDTQLKNIEFEKLKNYEFELFDMSGRKVSNETTTKGVYIVHVLNTNHSFKIIK